MFCGKCGSQFQDTPFCPSCGSRGGSGTAFCRACGERVGPAADNPAGGQYVLQERPRKKKMTAALFAFFLGYLGIHNLYLGFVGKGITQLLVTVFTGVLTCGISFLAMWIWAIIEGIMLTNGAINHDSQGQPLE